MLSTLRRFAKKNQVAIEPKGICQVNFSQNSGNYTEYSAHKIKLLFLPLFLRVWMVQNAQPLLAKHNKTKPLLFPGLYDSFLKGQGHQGIFSSIKGTQWGNCKLLQELFKGTKAMGRVAITYVAPVKCQACVSIVLGYFVFLKEYWRRLFNFVVYFVFLKEYWRDFGCKGRSCQEDNRWRWHLGTGTTRKW